MKKFNVLLIAIVMSVFASLSSCVKCTSCDPQPQRGPVMVNRGMHQKTVKGGATFTDGYLFDCLVGGFGEVRDQNGNHPKKMPCYDQMIIKRLDPNQGGWNFSSCGPCRVGGSADVNVWVYNDDDTLVPGKNPEVIESTWVIDEFYGN
jgi:hypothetical protein